MTWSEGAGWPKAAEDGFTSEEIRKRLDYWTLPLGCGDIRTPRYKTHKGQAEHSHRTSRTRPSHLPQCLYHAVREILHLPAQ